eukprot:gene25691-225_t
MAKWMLTKRLNMVKKNLILPTKKQRCYIQRTINDGRSDITPCKSDGHSDHSNGASPKM